MNLVLEKLGDGPIRRIVEVICIIAAAAFTGTAAWYFYTNAVRDFVRGHVSETLSETPLWLPPSIMLLGMLVFIVQLLAYLLRVLAGDVSFSDRVARGGNDAYSETAEAGRRTVGRLSHGTAGSRVGDTGPSCALPDARDLGGSRRLVWLA